MADISDQELEDEIKKILKDANLSTTSTKKVVQALEKNLGVDLTDKKKTIDQMVMNYVNSLESSEENQSSEANESSEEEIKEEKKRPPKRTKKKADDDRGKPAKAAKKAKGGGAKGKGNGYTRAYKLSPALADLMGAQEMPRHEVVKRMWEVIKERKLYDPNNKQFAICDDALYKVIGTKRFRIFGMMKYLKTHFLDD